MDVSSRPAPRRARTYGAEQAASAPGERLPWERVREWLENAWNYWLCTTRVDGRPHAVPVWGVWMDEAFLFSTGRGTVSERNIASNPHVVVHLESGGEVVIVEGVATAFEPADRFLDAYERKYDQRFDVEDEGTMFFRVDPRYALSWTELAEDYSDFPETSTRWDFAAKAR